MTPPEPNPKDVPEAQPTPSDPPENTDAKVDPSALCDSSSVKVDGDAACAVQRAKAKELAHRILSVLAVPAVLLVILYYQTFESLASVWMKDDNYSHGWFIPLFSGMFAMMAWQRREEEAEKVPLPSLENVSMTDIIGGSIELAAALAFHWFALIGGILILDVVALCIAISAILRIVGGMDLKKLFRFPVWFLIFMAPLPGKVYEPLARTLQLTAAKAATFVFELLGEPVFREGYVIKLRSEIMQVGAACSGIRSLTALIALPFVVAFFMNRGKIFRWTLILSGPFIAIGTNCIRVVITGYIMTRVGREWAEGTPHEVLGMILIGIGAIITILWAMVLAALEDNFLKPATAKATATDATQAETAKVEVSAEEDTNSDADQSSERQAPEETESDDSESK